MREYRVMIECANTRTVGYTIYAKDRDDAIKFIKRNHRTRFWSKEYKRIKSAKEINKKRDKGYQYRDSPPLRSDLVPELWQAWPADETQ